jgi:neurocan core protein
MKPVVVEYLNASGIMGREVSLTCKASGDPLPEVTFLKEGTLIPYTVGVQNSDDRIIVDTSREGEYAQARLVIRDLMRSDDGLYACIAKNNGSFIFLLFFLSFIGCLTRHPARQALEKRLRT